MTIKKYYPDYKLGDQGLIHSVIRKCYYDFSNKADFKDIIELVNICDEQCSNILFNEFTKHLEEHFDPEFYLDLALLTDYNYNNTNYLNLYFDYVIKNKETKQLLFGQYGHSDAIFLNFINLITIKNIDFDEKDKMLLIDLNEFEKWLLDPISYDYSNYNSLWLLDIPCEEFMGRILDLGIPPTNYTLYPGRS